MQADNLAEVSGFRQQVFGNDQCLKPRKAWQVLDWEKKISRKVKILQTCALLEVLDAFFEKMCPEVSNSTKEDNPRFQPFTRKHTHQSCCFADAMCAEDAAPSFRSCVEHWTQGKGLLKKDGEPRQVLCQRLWETLALPSSLVYSCRQSIPSKPLWCRYFCYKRNPEAWEDWVAAGTSRRSLEEDSPAWSYSLGAASCLCAWYKALYSPWSFAWWYLVSNSNQHHFSWEILLLVDLRPATTKSSTSPPNGPKNKNRKNKATQVIIIIFQRPTC